MSALDLQKIWLRRRAFAGRVAALFETIDLLLIPAQSMASPTQAQMETLGVDPEGFRAAGEVLGTVQHDRQPDHHPAGRLHAAWHAGGDSARAPRI